MPIENLRTSTSALSQLRVIYFAAGTYFVYFMLAVGLLKTAAHEDIGPGKSEFDGCSMKPMVKNGNALGL